MKLEVVVIPVSDVDRSKRFYGGLGWRLDADIVLGPDRRVVQLTPPGSDCSIHFGTGLTKALPGSAQGMILVVYDIESARAGLIGHGVDIVSVSLVVLVGTAMSAQDKYALKTSSGIAFSDFRGYEGWQVVSLARTDEVLKAIVANPTMIAAYKAGVPGNGKPFPDGSKIAKLQWKPKKSTDAPFVVDVPDTFSQAFLMEKDSKRFPNTTGGWGYALFNYDPASDTFAADASPADCGNSCHQAVKAKGYIFHPYQKR